MLRRVVRLLDAGKSTGNNAVTRKRHVDRFSKLKSQWKKINAQLADGVVSPSSTRGGSSDEMVPSSSINTTNNSRRARILNAFVSAHPQFQLWKYEALARLFTQGPPKQFQITPTTHVSFNSTSGSKTILRLSRSEVASCSSLAGYENVTDATADADWGFLFSAVRVTEENSVTVLVHLVAPTPPEDLDRCFSLFESADGGRCELVSIDEVPVNGEMRSDLSSLELLLNRMRSAKSLTLRMPINLVAEAPPPPKQLQLYRRKSALMTPTPLVVTRTKKRAGCPPPVIQSARAVIADGWVTLRVNVLIRLSEALDEETPWMKNFSFKKRRRGKARCFFHVFAPEDQRMIDRAARGTFRTHSRRRFYEVTGIGLNAHKAYRQSVTSDQLKEAISKAVNSKRRGSTKLSSSTSSSSSASLIIMLRSRIRKDMIDNNKKDQDDSGDIEDVETHHDEEGH